MTSTDVALVQSSFRKIVPIADQAAALFFARLFEIDPALRSVFGGDIQEQGHELIILVEAAVSSLACPEALVPTISTVGANATVGAMEEHRAAVGAALLWTLQKGLGLEFTPAVCAAWASAYALLFNTVKEAQRRPHVAA